MNSTENGYQNSNVLKHTTSLGKQRDGPSSVTKIPEEMGIISVFVFGYIKIAEHCS